MMSTTELNAAITAAGHFLLSRRGGGGLWSDFRTEAGRSDEWVSGFAAYALAQAGGAADLAATFDALIARQRRNGGWGYNEFIPADSDSTGWVLLALSTAAARKPSIAQRGRRFLRSHQDAAIGGFSTYLARDGIDRVIGAPAGAVIDGWLQPQPCVTGLVVQSLLVQGERVDGPTVRSAVAYLLGQRTGSGAWPSYWWKGQAYSTYLCLKAVWAAHGLARQAVRTTLQTVLARQRTDGGWSDTADGPSEAFATAFSILVLLLFPELGVMADAGRGVAWLLRRQDDGGGWPTAPILRIPAPMTAKPDGMTVASWSAIERGTSIIVPDQHAVYTSSAALWALCAYRILRRPTAMFD